MRGTDLFSGFSSATTHRTIATLLLMAPPNTCHNTAGTNRQSLHFKCSEPCSSWGSPDTNDLEKPYPIHAIALRSQQLERNTGTSNALPELSSPIINTVFLPPHSESASRPQSIPVHTCAAVFDPTIIPAWVEIKVSEAEGSKYLS